MTRAGLSLALLALLATGCAGPLGRARDAFAEGRYPDAVADLRRLEPEVADWSDDERAHYALTRGLAHLACGDARQALYWLSSAKRHYDADPEVFDEKERGRLFAAWRAMGLMPAEGST
jgi:hypothetical protein